ncbi:hypothetical protein [Streptomyces sp. NPDC047869]|uniref:hypothetical protein n=1 Tax=Streptomyces sp. NPDC047869 TaxID=3154709 RepID=UPI0034525852
MSAVAEPDRAGLVTIALDTARALFCTAEVSSSGLPGTDEIFGQWLDSGFDVAFYRSEDRPLQARAVSQGEHVPGSLISSRIGKARLESVCLNPHRHAPVGPRNPDPVSAEGEEADGTEARTGAGMPGIHRGDADKRRYAKVEYQEDTGCVLTVVDDFADGTGKESAYHLGGDITSDTDGDWFETLTTLTELAQARLETEGWAPNGPWQIQWWCSSCDVTDPPYETLEVFEEYGFDPDEITQHYVSIYSQGSNGYYTVEFSAEHRGEDHVMYLQLELDADRKELGSGSLEELRSHLAQATERVREAGYTPLDSDWSIHWTHCHVPLTEL